MTQMGNHHPRRSWPQVLVLVLLAQTHLSWGWFFSSNKGTHHSSQKPSEDMAKAMAKGLVGEFAMEAFNDQKGRKQLEDARIKMLVSDVCMQIAYQKVFASCAKILADEELKSRLAWHLSECFHKMSGRPFPRCDPKSSITNCVKLLDDHAHSNYLSFYLEANSICHQLQNEAFRYRTETLVNGLVESAERAEEKLGNMEERGELLLKNANDIHDSLASIDVRTQKVAETSQNVEDYVNAVLKHSEAIYEESRGIAASQAELREDQQNMKEKLEEGMRMLQDSYENLGVEIDNIKNEAIEIEKEVGKVGDAISSKMTTLQRKADDIGNMAGLSLEKQKELLDSQSAALEGLNSLTKSQSQALEESRNTLQRLAEFGRKQQDELLQRQEQLQRAHDYLVENSRTILAAQEAFESKQASMFLAIDKLFALHNALLLESRLIKAFLYYSLAIFLVYMFTSTKQTYNVRPRLYIGLCITFFVESVVLRYATNVIEQPVRIISVIRSLSVLLAAAQLLYAIVTYRDYEVLNHHMLLQLIDKVNGMQRTKELSWDVESDADSDVDWSTWVEAELPEDVSKLEDPDYYVLHEGVGENSPSFTKRYNLRNRHDIY